MPSAPKNIQLLLLDVDGVLTDGVVRYSARGDEEKSLFMRDIDAVFEAHRRGLVVGLVTGESTPWVDFIARRLAIDHVAKGVKDKLDAVRRLSNAVGISIDAVCYVGDADRDVPALEAVGLGLAPHDASGDARRAAKRVLASSGGRGAVAEAVEAALNTRIAEADADPREHFDHTTHLEGVQCIRQMFDTSVELLQAVARDLAPEIARAANVITEALIDGCKVLIFGNGGSAADAEHMAAELVGRFRRERPGLPAIALTGNSAVLTALGNDYGQAELFARQVDALGKAGDVAVAISTSGRSENVTAAARRARVLGLRVIALTGSGGGDLRELADVPLLVPSAVVERIQEAHTVMIHAICSTVEEEMARRAADAHLG